VRAIREYTGTRDIPVEAGGTTRQVTTSKKTHMLGAALCRGLILTSALAAALTVQAQQSEQPKTYPRAAGGTDTASCLKEAAQMNAAVIKVGQLGSQKAQNPDLKRFSEQIEADHKRAQDKLETIAKNHNVELPTTLSAKCQEELSKLQALSGAEFDKEFAKGAVQGYAMGIAKLQEASVQAKEPDVAQYAKDRLARLKRHQERAREIAKTVGLGQATIAALETQLPEGVGTSGANSQTERGTASPQSNDQGERKDLQPQP
jgi:putative membrane protein